MLNIAQVLTRSFGLLAAHPFGIVWVLVQALLVSIFTLGLMAGPMQVGVYTVLIHYARTGNWNPESLWGHTNAHNIVAGIVFVASALAAFAVGLPITVPNTFYSTQHFAGGHIQLRWPGCHQPALVLHLPDHGGRRPALAQGHS